MDVVVLEESLPEFRLTFLAILLTRDNNSNIKSDLNAFIKIFKGLLTSNFL